MSSLLMSAVWIYTGIQSPFLISCFYPTMSRHPRIASPSVVVPAITAVCGYFFVEGVYGGGYGTYYSHFIYAAAFMLCCYFVCLRSGFSAPQSLLLAVLTEIAIDELWQMPYNLTIWPQSLLNFEVGIATAGWNLMSLPLIFYFLYSWDRSPRIAGVVGPVLLADFGMTAWATAIMALDDIIRRPTFSPDWLLFPWFLFFVLMYRATARPDTALPRPCESAESGRLSSS